jgi:V/A-type H+-transporting ATPase subunit I
MIVPMKKVTVVVQEKDASSAVNAMRSLGVLHVEHEVAPAGKDINELQDDLALINRAIAILSETEFFSKKATVAKEPSDWKSNALHIVDLRKRYDQLRQYSLTLKKAISDWQPWGDFDPQAIKQLNGKNIYVRFFQIPLKDIKNLPAEVVVKKISVKTGVANCALISREKIEVPFKELNLPQMGLARMQARLVEDARVVQVIKEEVKQQTVRLESFFATGKLLENELELHQVRRGMGQIGNFMYLTGYAPFDVTDTLLAAAKKQKWGILVGDPSEEDNVPTLIRSPRWVALISPLFKLLEIIPGYRELDISPLFLIFFSLFFGMIIGDAGYGIIYMLLTFLLQKKFGRKIDQKIFLLLYLLTSCAVFWGLLTGTVFGQEWYLKSGLKPLAPILNDTKFLQAFCFLLGAFHLSLGHLWQAIHKAPSLSALADLGWTSLLWAGFFLAKTLILNDPFPFFGQWLIIGGITLAILFSSPQKNILKMVGGGLANVLLSLVNSFTDVVSYIRLFAVGLAGVAIADTVNILAADFGASNPLVKVMIVFLGHTMNLVLAPLSVLIHGVRLNILEFSGHAGLSWSGIEYKPLKESP